MFWFRIVASTFFSETIHRESSKTKIGNLKSSRFVNMWNSSASFRFFQDGAFLFLNELFYRTLKQIQEYVISNLLKKSRVTPYLQSLTDSVIEADSETQETGFDSRCVRECTGMGHALEPAARSAPPNGRVPLLK